jgi:hypothetical protein
MQFVSVFRPDLYSYRYKGITQEHGEHDTIHLKISLLREELGYYPTLLPDLPDLPDPVSPYEHEHETLLAHAEDNRKQFPEIYKGNKRTYPGPLFQPGDAVPVEFHWALAPTQPEEVGETMEKTLERLDNENVYLTGLLTRVRDVFREADWRIGGLADWRNADLTNATDVCVLRLLERERGILQSFADETHTLDEILDEINDFEKEIDNCNI